MSALGLRDHLTHRGNVRSSRYGWLRLTPMYSVHLVDELLDADLRERDGRVLDPFCGTGTTALVCAERGIPADTADINPFLLWLTQVKTHPYTQSDIASAGLHAEVVVEAARDTKRGVGWVPPLRNIEKWWEADLLGALSRAWDVLQRCEPLPARWLLTVAFLRAAIKTAHVTFGHQSMSFRQQSGREGVGLFEAEWREALGAILSAAESPIVVGPRTILADARKLGELEPASYATIITSPPYCNRMSYVRELRPYMYWTGYLTDGRAAGELDWQAIGGTWGIATSNVAKWEAPPGESVEVPFEGFDRIVEQIADHSAVLSRYVAKYFHDVVLHAREVVGVLEPAGAVHYVVGNSKFYDVLVPAEKIYAAVFESVGFEDISVRVIRKRTSKKELYEFLVSARHPG